MHFIVLYNKHNLTNFKSCYFWDNITRTSLFCCKTPFQYLLVLYKHKINNTILGIIPLQHLTPEIIYVSNDFIFQKIKINYGSNKETKA